MVIVFYRLLFFPLFCLLMPYYLRRMVKRGGYAHSIKERFGFFPHLPKEEGKRRIWIQAVSVGEVQALEEFFKLILSEPSVEVILTTTTSTGYAMAKQLYSGQARHIGFFPLDFWAFSALAWKRLQPDVICLMEGELWPEHLHQAKKRGIPFVLLNGRLSDRSFKRYQYVSQWVRKILGSFSFIFASSLIDKERFLALGASPHQILNVGNLKFDSAVRISDEAELASVRKFLGITEKTMVLLGASTWPGEEQLLIEVLERARKQGMQVRLILVPRHAERRQEIVDVLRETSFKWALRTQVAQSEYFPDIYLVDTTGELRFLIQLADIVFIGKSLEPHEGGQNPIEAAAFGKTIVYGPRMSNFRAICKQLEACGGSVCAAHHEAIAQELLVLLNDAQKRQILGQNAREWYMSQQGASERTVRMLKPWISQKISKGQTL